MRKPSTALALVAVPVAALALVGAWAAFRPELLFVNRTVSESAPAASAVTLASGAFTGYAHETTGRASLVKAGGETLVRLSGFSTSNGPDVHVYLVKGGRGTQDAVNAAGYLDLGTIKGNRGDQNYAVPAGTHLAEYGAVAIWCKRFGVDFGGATLASEPETPKTALLDAGLRLAGYGYGTDIVVTSGAFRTGGTAAIVEANGRRVLRVVGAKAPAGTRVFLLKAESATTEAAIHAAPKIDLGTLKAGAKVQEFPIAKSVDAWLYRTVSLSIPGRSLATTLLRSDQERGRKPHAPLA